MRRTRWTTVNNNAPPLKSQKWSNDFLQCPNGCEAAVATHDEEEELFYRVPGDEEESINYTTTAIVPVRTCECCGERWTDFVSEEIRSVAIVAARLKDQIDDELTQKILKECGRDK